MDEESLRREIAVILAKTSAAKTLPVGGFWVGDKAGERRVFDDLASGRLTFRSARDLAEDALRSLDGGDADRAMLSIIVMHWKSALGQRTHCC
jgi:hypothetical protein